jgi:spore maturation protein SpmB
MILNLSANALGLGNAATPFGIRAMQELDRLNPARGTATNAMALFLAINTSSVTLLPTGVIALRASAGSADAAAILPTTLLATIGSTAAAILGAKLYQRFRCFRGIAPSLPGACTARPSGTGCPAVDGEKGRDGENTPGPEDGGDPKPPDEAAAAARGEGGYPLWVSLAALACLLAMIPVAVVFGKSVSPWILPSLMAGFLGFGLMRRVRVYEVFVEGAREGFQVALRIIPYLVAILTAVGMLRASGALDLAVGFLGKFTGPLGLPAEALPMALMRPLSGSGAYGILASILNDPAVGPDSYTGYLVSTLQGSTETTFYVMAVYFGAVQVRRVRHTLAAALTADVAGVVFAVLACTLFLS